MTNVACRQSESRAARGTRLAFIEIAAAYTAFLGSFVFTAAFVFGTF